MPFFFLLGDLELAVINNLPRDEYERLRAELKLPKVPPEHLSQAEALRLIRALAALEPTEPQ